MYGTRTFFPHRRTPILRMIISVATASVRNTVFMKIRVKFCKNIIILVQYFNRKPTFGVNSRYPRMSITAHPNSTPTRIIVQSMQMNVDLDGTQKFVTAGFYKAIFSEQTIRMYAARHSVRDKGRIYVTGFSCFGIGATLFSLK